MEFEIHGMGVDKPAQETESVTRQKARIGLGALAAYLRHNETDLSNHRFFERLDHPDMRAQDFGDVELDSLYESAD